MNVDQANVRAILFDAGDTLLFPKPSREEMFRRVAAQIGLTLSIEAIQRGYRHLDYHLARHGHSSPGSTPLPREGLDGVAMYNALILEGTDFSGDIVAVAKAITQAFDAIERFEFQVFDETRDLLFRLAGDGYKLGIVSNWDESLESICTNLGLMCFFDAIVASQVVGFAKPDRRFFEIALQRLDVKPADAVHIGDSYHTDVIGAWNAGITPILFDWKKCHPDADYLCIETLDELINHL